MKKSRVIAQVVALVTMGAVLALGGSDASVLSDGEVPVSTTELALSTNTDVKNELAEITAKVKVVKTFDDLINEINVENIKAEAKIKEVEEIKPAIVYEDMTIEELSAKLDRVLKSTLSGKGSIFASYSLEKGVDPYLAVAIVLQETGCYWGHCSALVYQCNNVGGMKGAGGCGSYAYFNSLEQGITGYIDNLYNGYVSQGLTTAELMNPRYAEDQGWASKVNAYIQRIKGA